MPLPQFPHLHNEKPDGDPVPFQFGAMLEEPIRHREQTPVSKGEVGAPHSHGSGGAGDALRQPQGAHGSPAPTTPRTPAGCWHRALP